MSKWFDCVHHLLAHSYAEREVSEYNVLLFVYSNQYLTLRCHERTTQKIKRNHKICGFWNELKFPDKKNAAPINLKLIPCCCRIPQFLSSVILHKAAVTQTTLVFLSFRRCRVVHGLSGNFTASSYYLAMWAHPAAYVIICHLHLSTAQLCRHWDSAYR